MAGRGSWVSWVVLACVLGAGCDDRGPAGPSSENVYAGVWSGVISDLSAGVGTARLEITQTGLVLAGTFATQFPNAAFNRAGVVSGGVAGGSVQIGLIPPSPVVCSATVTLTGTQYGMLTLVGDRLAGPYTEFKCEGGGGGHLDLTKVVP